MLPLTLGKPFLFFFFRISFLLELFLLFLLHYQFLFPYEIILIARHTHTKEQYHPYGMGR